MSFQAVLEIYGGTYSCILENAVDNKFGKRFEKIIKMIHLECDICQKI